MSLHHKLMPKMTYIKPSIDYLEHIHQSITRGGIDIAIQSYKDNKMLNQLAKQDKLTRVLFIEKNKIPQKIYKFIHSPFGNENPPPQKTRKEKIESILINHKLYLSSGSDFNDPFDVLPTFITKFNHSKIKKLQTRSADIFKIPQSEIKKFVRHNTSEFLKNPTAGIEKLTNALREITYGTGIYCFTSELSNILMWSHYAENHKGICIEFETCEDLGIATNIHPIKYKSTRPSIDIFDDFSPKSYIDFYMVKSLDWQYEKEYRLTYSEKSHKLVAFSRKFISKVIIGAKASTETVAYLNDINEKRESQGLPRFEIAQAKLSDTEYKIEVHPI